MALNEELARAAQAAAALADREEEVRAVLPTEPFGGARIYLCAYERRSDGRRAWLALDAGGRPVHERATVRDAVSIAALCELAEETAAGGDVAELRGRLVAVRLTENPPGIEEAEEAALALEAALGSPPRVASPAYLDAVGTAAHRLDQALGDETGSPFAAAMHAGMAAVDALTTEVEAAYKVELR